MLAEMWQAGDCQRIMLRWFDRGMVDCFADTSVALIHYEHNANWRSRAAEEGQQLILDRGDARALLSDPATWNPEGTGAGVMLRESGIATGLPFDDWFNALAGLPEEIISDQ